MRVFLDYAATTPLKPEVREAMEPWLNSGNASALYEEGRAAKDAVDEAREQVSARLGCDFAEVIFTSSGTESAALAMVGTALAHEPNERDEVVISAAEHHCCLNCRETLERLGYRVLWAPVDRYARLDLDWLEDRLRSGQVLLVAAMHANNELGSLNACREIAEICKQFGTLYFSDAVQTFGKLPFSAEALGADLISASGHKIGGPKGVGALYVKAGTKLKPVIAGGGQERELRAGTENVAAIAGLGRATGLAGGREIWESVREKSRTLRGFLLELGFVPTLPDDLDRLDGHVHVRAPGHSAETFLILLDRLGVSAGSGAACSSGSIEPSHVLLACGYSEAEAKEGIRFTLGPEITSEALRFAKETIAEALHRLSQKRTIGTGTYT